MPTAFESLSLPKKIKERQAEYEKIRNPYDAQMADIIDFCQPGLTDWYSETEGSFGGDKIYEGTPAWALRVMVNGWLGNLISQSDTWRRYMFPEKKLRDNDDINQWLQDMDDFMWSVYNSRSDFYQMMPSYALSAFSVGSPIMTIYRNKTTNKIECEVPHPKENYHGPLGQYHRKYQLTAVDALKEFMGGEYPSGDDVYSKSKLSRALLDAIKNGNHFTRFQFVRAVYPKDDPILENEDAKYKTHDWMEFYIQSDVEDNSLGSKEPILIQGYDSKPHVRWDYEINDNEFYARTPSWHAMMDIKSQQELFKQMIEAGQRQLHPAQWVNKKYRGNFSDMPKARVYYDKADEGAGLSKQVQENIRYDIGADVHDRIKQSVERWYNVPLFQILSQLAAQKQGWPTATHIIRMDAEKASQLSSQIGYFTGVLQQIDDRFYDLMKTEAPPPPPVVVEYMMWRRDMFGDSSFRLPLEFLGPLTQVQRKSSTVQRAELGLAILSRYASLDQTLIHKVRLSKSLEGDLEEIGFPQDRIVPEDEYQDTVAVIQQAEAKAMQQAQLLEAAKTVPALGKKVEGGSMLGNLMGKEEE